MNPKNTGEFSAEANYESKEHWGVFRAYRYSPEYCNRFGELPSPA